MYTFSSFLTKVDSRESSRDPERFQRAKGIARGFVKTLEQRKHLTFCAGKPAACSAGGNSLRLLANGTLTAVAASQIGRGGARGTRSRLAGASAIALRGEKSQRFSRIRPTSPRGGTSPSAGCLRSRAP